MKFFFCNILNLPFQKKRFDEKKMTMEKEDERSIKPHHQVERN